MGNTRKKEFNAKACSESDPTQTPIFHPAYQVDQNTKKNETGQPEEENLRSAQTYETSSSQPLFDTKTSKIEAPKVAWSNHDEVSEFVSVKKAKIVESEIPSDRAVRFSRNVQRKLRWKIKAHGTFPDLSSTPSPGKLPLLETNEELTKKSSKISGLPGAQGSRNSGFFDAREIEASTKASATGEVKTPGRSQIKHAVLSTPPRKLNRCRVRRMSLQCSESSEEHEVKKSQEKTQDERKNTVLDFGGKVEASNASLAALNVTPSSELAEVVATSGHTALATTIFSQDYYLQSSSSSSPLHPEPSPLSTLQLNLRNFKLNSVRIDHKEKKNVTFSLAADSDGNTTSNPRAVMESQNQNALSLPQIGGGPRHHYGREPDNHRNWRDYTFLKIYVTRLPQDATTFQIWMNFNKYGNVSQITLDANERKYSTTTAVIWFKPVPSKAFWERPDGRPGARSIQYREGNKATRAVEVRLDRKQGKTFTVKSPVRMKVEYNEENTLIADSIDFGVLHKRNSMLVFQTRRSDTNDKVQFTLNLRSLAITIIFPSVVSSTRQIATRQFRFLASLDQNFRIIQVDEEKGRFSLVLCLETPPPYSKKLMDSAKGSHVKDAKHWREEDAWARQTDMVDQKATYDILERSPVSLCKAFNSINIGRWTTFRLAFDLDNGNRDTLKVIRDALRDFNIPLETGRDNNFQWLSAEASKPTLWTILDNPSKFHSSGHSDWIQMTSGTHLSFPVRYQLEVCISHGRLSEYLVDAIFLRELAKLPESKGVQLLRAVAASKYPKKAFYTPMAIFNDLEFRKPVKLTNLPDNCVEIPHATVTATSVLYNTPSVEVTNRIIRQFSQHADRFLRVRFEDDDYRGNTRLYASTNNKMTNIFTRVRRTMTNGITLGDRHFEFLAWGNSQLREHGAYFFASNPNDLTASKIRAFMGQFGDEMIVAKRAARMGQCFSTTRAIKCRINRINKHELIPDITTNDLKYNFTDGVGRMSQLVASLAHQQMTRSELVPKTVPSVLQFRLGGCKGVLAIDPSLHGIEIKVRESQFKFASNSNELEAIRWSEFWKADLNRQLILVLAGLGVRPETFLAKQEEVINQVSKAMVDDEAALKVLKDHVDANSMTLVLADMISVGGFRSSNEPFVTSLLHLWRSWFLKYLKEKAKLPVHKGAFVLGCIDETATLHGHFEHLQPPEGSSHEEMEKNLPEIFLQITDPQTQAVHIIQGVCAIARNPSLHLGDVRVVKAINVPALHHLRDVLVMPQTGDRDLPNMCSGGDLDGDDYIVIWDEDLLPKKWNVAPFDFTPTEPVKSTSIAPQHIINFFVDYMEKDFLGRIAHAHLAWADKHGLDSPQCLELVGLHSKAVDFPKTGVAANLPRRLEPVEWPHFMEKKSAPYKSSGVLGQMYDAVERVAFVPNYKAPFDERILKAYQPSLDTFKFAQALKDEYDQSMFQIMAQHQIKTEFEVWSTLVLKHSKASSEYKFHEEIGHISRNLREQFRDEIVQFAGGRDQQHLAPFAVAAYQITQAEVDRALKEIVKDNRDLIDPSQMPLISFPWVLHDVLNKIASGASLREVKSHQTSTFVNGVMIEGEPGLLYDQDGNPTLEAGSGNVQTGPLKHDWKGQHFSDPYKPPEKSIINEFTNHEDDEVLLDVPVDFQILPPDDLDLLTPFKAASLSTNSNCSKIVTPSSSQHDLLEIDKTLPGTSDHSDPAAADRENWLREAEAAAIGIDSDSD